MKAFILLALTSLMGSDDFQTRERATGVLTLLNNVCDVREDLYPVFVGHPDPEVRRRVGFVLDAYYADLLRTIPWPALQHFPCPTGSQEWVETVADVTGYDQGMVREWLAHGWLANSQGVYDQKMAGISYLHGRMDKHVNRWVLLAEIRYARTMETLEWLGLLPEPTPPLDDWHGP